MLGDPGMGDEVVEQRGGEVQGADPLLLDQAQCGSGIPAPLADEAAADERHRDHRVVAHRVVEGHHAERAVAEAIAVLHDLREPAGAFGGVRAGNALRPARGPGRVEHDATARARRGRTRPGARDRRAGTRAARRLSGAVSRPSPKRSSRPPPGRPGARAARRRRPATGRPRRAAPSRAGYVRLRRGGRRGRSRRVRARRPAGRRARAGPRSRFGPGPRRLPRPWACARPRREARAPGSLLAATRRRIASTIGSYPVQRQSWPESRSTTSSRVGTGLRARKSVAAIRIPGVQKPHWRA